MWKGRKYVQRRKKKKEKEDALTREIRLTVETGKVVFGFRRAVLNALFGKAKAFVVAANVPQEMKDEVVRYARLSSLPVIEFKGTSLELGSVCGKPFPVAVLSVFDPGTSKLLEMAGE